MRRLLAIGVVLLWSSVGVSGQAQSTAPLIHVADVRFVGVAPIPRYCTPQGTSGRDEQRLTYTSGGTGLGPKGGLILNGHDWYHAIAEISLPVAGRTSTILTPCYDVGKLAQVGPNTVKTGGALVYNGRLILSAYVYYDGTGAATQSHATANTSTGELSDWQPVGQLGAGYVAGYMALIPQEWRALLGGPALTGQGALSIISRTNSGPGVSVFDPDRLTGTGAPAQPLLYYPLSHPLANKDVANTLFSYADSYGGIVFPSGTRSVLIVGSHGNGAYCYGEGAQCNDPTNGSKGEHAYPYVCQAWAYDANDLVRVKNGQIQPWEPRPYAIIPLHGINDSGGCYVPRGGATYNPSTKELYIVAGGENPRTYIYTIAGGTTPPPVPNVDCKPGTTWTLTSASPYGACVNGQQTRQELWTRQGDVPAQGNGKACSPNTETRTSAPIACTVEPPPPVVPTTFTVPITCTFATGVWSCR